MIEPRQDSACLLMVMSVRRRFLSPSVRLDGVFDVVILLALSGSWIGLLGDWHWFADLFSHFRWQYLIIALLAVFWSFWRRRRVRVFISLITLVLNAWLIGGLAWRVGSFAKSEVSQEKVRIVSLNVLTSNQRYADVLGYLRFCDADLIFLMEVDDVWAAAMDVLKDTHPHHLVHAREDNFGIALYSRLPLTGTRIIHELPMGQLIGPFATPMIQAHLKLGSRQLIFHGIHPVPPGGSTAWLRRNDQLRAVATQVAATDVPSLALGDFNSTPWCSGMRSIREKGVLDFHSLSPPWQPTWRAASVFAIPIDHALCTSSLIITHRQIGPDVGSDHRPQWVDVHWTEP